MSLPLSMETKRALNRALRAEADLYFAINIGGSAIKTRNELLTIIEQCHACIDASAIIPQRAISHRGLVDRVKHLISACTGRRQGS